MTVTVAPTVEASNVPPRVRLNITASAGETSTTITRLNPDGSVVPVRTNDGNPLTISGGTALLYDYETPFGPVSYSSLESPGTVSAQVTIDAGSVWLVHPGVPALSMAVELRVGSLAEESYAVSQGVFRPMGRANPVIVTDGTRKGMQSSMTVGVDNANDLRAIRALISDAGVLFLNIPASLGYVVDSCYIAVGDVRITRPSTVGSDPHRDIELPFYVVDRPAGGSQAARTLLDLLDYPTLNSLQAAYPTLTALLAGP